MVGALQESWVFIKNDMMMADGSLGSSKEEKSPHEKLQQQTEDHNLSVNNQSTQEWFTSFLPDAQAFRDELTDFVHRPGTAMHDPNFGKHTGPFKKLGNALDEAIAYMRSHQSDTPGAGRSGAQGVEDDEEDEGDEEYY
jgi:hypothetical protein